MPQKQASHSFVSVLMPATAENNTEVIRTVKDNGLKCRYSLMKAYLLNPEELAEEALKLQNMGVDEVTIMDSAGCMLPDEVKEYVKALKNKVSIPVGFHCHNNLGMSAANAQAAMESGVDLLDCGLLGMARSARKPCNRDCSSPWHTK